MSIKNRLIDCRYIQMACDIYGWPKINRKSFFFLGSVEHDYKASILTFFMSCPGQVLFWLQIRTNFKVLSIAPQHVHILHSGGGFRRIFHLGHLAWPPRSRVRAPVCMISSTCQVDHATENKIIVSPRSVSKVQLKSVPLLRCKQSRALKKCVNK